MYFYASIKPSINKYIWFSYDDIFSTRNFEQALEQRVGTLERELDASIAAAARARSEKRQAEAAQRAAELRAQDVAKELENTTSMYAHLCHFMLHSICAIIF